MTLFVVPIVEGATEIACIKRLLSRIWTELLAVDELHPLAVLIPIPTDRSSLVKPGDPELEDRIRGAKIRLKDNMWQPDVDAGMILVLIDADEDCPAKLGPDLLRRARAVRSDADIACVMPKRELENWFKAAAASLAGVQGLPADLKAVADPEVGSGDNWLTRQMQKTDGRRTYSKPADALEFVERMDLVQARINSPSFDKLCRELERRLPADGDVPTGVP